MNFDLYKSTIFLTLSGSRSYGIANEDSDYDYRGVCIPPLDNYIGVFSKFEQTVSSKTNEVWTQYPEGLIEPNADMQVMELTKFCRLALDCNPSIIEILFSNDDSVVLKHPVINLLIENRDSFLSKRAKARFCGYAFDQLHRIKRHKRWLDNPPTKQPLREDYGLPGHGVISTDQIGAAEAMIKREVQSFVLDQQDLPEHTKIELNNGLSRMMQTIWLSINNSPYPVGEGKKFESIEEALLESTLVHGGFSDNFIEILKKERKYRAACKEWKSYQIWLKERNPARAKLERKFGLDLKHATHLVRLIRIAREILETGKVHVLRPDAEELRSIRAGAWTYEKICEFAEAEDLALNDIVKKSKLPASPDLNKIQDIVFNMVMNFNTGDENVDMDGIKKIIHERVSK